jgi:putative acetyltransferase
MDSEIREATWPIDLRGVRSLFEEYAASLDFSLCFQGFERELAELPGAYGPPGGVVLLAQRGDVLSGCVALRPWASADAAGRPACEMKRLYVRPEARGSGAGRQLCTRLIAWAQAAGYQRMLLDTVASMQAAIGLYGALGFQETPAYRPNPLPDVRYFALDLTAPVA